jgi:hypothetical protein
VTVKITVHNLVTDTDAGTNTGSYSTQQEAERAYIELINSYLRPDMDLTPAETYEEARWIYDELSHKYGCIDSIGIVAETVEFGPKPPAEGLIRFYVVKAWDNFPEGGTCGEIVWAKDCAGAEMQMLHIMADRRIAAYSTEHDPASDHEDEIQATIRDYQQEWHTIDCWPVDGFIEKHLGAS